MAPIELLKRVPLFSGLDEAQLMLLAPYIHRRGFGHHEMVFQQGERGSSLYIVDQGEVSITLIQPDGGQLVLDILGQGGVFGEMSLLDGGKRSATAITRGRAVLYTMHRDDFMASLQRHPGVAMEVIRLLSSRLREADASLEGIRKLPLLCDLARKLLVLAAKHGRQSPDGIVIALKLSQEQLADMIGRAREPVNRALGQLRDAGAVDYDGPLLVVRHPDCLERMAAGDIEVAGLAVQSGPSARPPLKAVRAARPTAATSNVANQLTAAGTTRVGRPTGGGVHTRPSTA